MANRGLSRGWSVALIALASLLLVSADARAGCEKDTDCKGDRICVDGECVEPVERTSCEEDVDCQGGEVCAADGACRPVEDDERPSEPSNSASPTGGTSASPTGGTSASPTGGTSASPTGGIIRVHTRAPGTVYVNHGDKWIEKWGQVGRVEGEPFEISGLPPGPHGIKVEYDFGDDEEQAATVIQGVVSEVQFETEVPTSELNSPAMLGVGIPLMVVGCIMSVAGGATIGTANQLQWDERSGSMVEEPNVEQENRGGVVLGIGGAALIAGVILTIAGAWSVPFEPEGEETAITVEPLIGPTGGGLRVRF